MVRVKALLLALLVLLSGCQSLQAVGRHVRQAGASVCAPTSAGPVGLEGEGRRRGERYEVQRWRGAGPDGKLRQGSDAWEYCSWDDVMRADQGDYFKVMWNGEPLILVQQAAAMGAALATGETPPSYE